MFAKERSRRVKMTQREENYFSETRGKSRLCQACAGTQFKPHVLSFNHFSASMHVALATESDFCPFPRFRHSGGLVTSGLGFGCVHSVYQPLRKACEPNSVLLTGRSDE